MSLALLAVVVLVLLGLGYRLYGGFVSRQYALNDGAPTPAERLEDGVDFVPTRPFYLLGQHFSAIAAAGPIAGPILAAQQFGWLPAVLWILFGVIFIGAVHDLSTLVASVRHEGRSIAEVVKSNLGPRSGVAMMAFIWVALVYVIVAFTDVTASTFVAGASLMFAKWSRDFQKEENMLTLFDPAAATAAGGDPNIRYYHNYWRLAPDEALVIDVTPPECDAWNFQLDNHWLESLDYRYYRIHVNQATARYRGDGAVRVVVAHADPGVDNWINTVGHDCGVMTWRWIRAKAHPTPQARVVKLSEVASLP